MSQTVLPFDRNFQKNIGKHNLDYSILTWKRLMKILWKDSTDQAIIPFVIFFGVPHF